MTATVMPLETLAPFAIMLGLTLAVFFVVHLIEGYEPPKSISDSLKRLFGSIGGWIAGFLVAHTLLDGLKFSEDLLASLLGAATAIVIMLSIDMLVLRSRTKRRDQTGDVK